MTRKKNHNSSKKKNKEAKKKFIKVDDILAFTLLIFVAMYIYTHFSSQTAIIPKPTPKLVVARDLLARKTSISSEFLNTSMTSSVCTLFLKNTAELPMKDFANEFVDHQFDKIINTCLAAIPTPLQVVIEAAFLKCKSSSHVHLAPECYDQLIQVKSKSVATIIKPEANLDDLDAIILLQLVADQFQSGDFLENPEKSLSTIDALLDKEPNFFNGYKFKLLVLSRSSLATH